MSAEPVLLAVGFDEPGPAGELLAALEGLAAQGRLDLLDAAFITKDAGGIVEVRETRDLRAGPAALGGGWIGMFVGLLLGGPAGGLLGGAAGALGGAVVAEVVDLGIPDATLRQLEELVGPAGTTLVVLVAASDVDAVTSELSGFEAARLVHATLPEADIRRLREVIERGMGPTG